MLRSTAAAALATTLTLIAAPALADPPGIDPDAQPAIAVPEAEGTSLSLGADSLAPGASLLVEYRTPVEQEKNWIGIYPASAGSPDGVPAASLWKYAGGAAGGLRFDTAKLSPGPYLVWMLAEDGYQPLTAPQALTVTDAGGLDFTPAKPVETSPRTDRTIHRQNFSGSALPDGWEVTRGEELDAAGPGAYRGWTLTTRRHWQAHTDRMRGRFGPAAGTIAVADAAQSGVKPYATTMRSAPIPVAGEKRLELSFASHYRSAAGQSATVSVSFDGGKSQELIRLDETNAADADAQLAAEQRAAFEVPAGAQRAQLSFAFDAPAGGHYWGIDSIAVRRPLGAAPGGSTNAWVVSDIQGHPGDFRTGLEKMSGLRPDPAGLLMVGDIVATGTAGQWQEIRDVMDATASIRPDTTVAAIGNHERYAAGGWTANRDRFLSFAERDLIWGEYVLEGAGGELPVITIGQDASGPSEVPISDEQARFLTERLEHWTKQNRQVLIATHYPLADTVSGSWQSSLQRAHQRNAQLTDLLASHPNAILLTGHTHFDGRLADWQTRRRTATGHPDGFAAINTTAMHNGWKASGEDSTQAVELPGGDMNQGLTVESYGDRVTVRAYDFVTDEQINEVTIPNPLVD